MKLSDLTFNYDTTANNWPTYQNVKPIDKDGNWTPQWSQIMQGFLSYAQTNFSSEGVNFPQQTTDNITTIIGPSPSTRSDLFGRVWYDTDLNEAKIFINGTVKTFTVT